MSGDLCAVIGGPNCRTRSVLRSYDGGPPQARAWTEDQQWGKHDASPEDLKKVAEDDELMFKMIAIYLVAKYTRKVEINGGRVERLTSYWSNRMPQTTSRRW